MDSISRKECKKRLFINTLQLIIQPSTKDKNGNFINLTNYYGKELILLEQDRVNIDGKIWVCKESFR